MNTPLSDLFFARQRYANYPLFQRNFVWPMRMQRDLIDSILMGFYIQPLILAIRPEGGYWIIDGQQRLTTILSFMDDGFKTGGYRDPVDDLDYYQREQRRYYSELSSAARAHFDYGYFLNFVVIEESDLSILSSIYRRIQRRVPLSTSDTLWSYTSRLTAYAQEVEAFSSFFTTIYVGKNHHHQRFQMSLYPLVMEATDIFTGLDNQRLKLLCSGKKDRDLSRESVERVLRRLSLIEHLYQGSHVSVMTEMILLYQSILLLEAAGISPDLSDAGCLTEWYKIVQQENQLSRDTGFMNVFSQFPKVHYQRQIWERHLLSMATQPGLRSTLKQETVVNRNLNRLLAWMQTAGHCIQCKKPVALAEVEAHVLRVGDLADPTLVIRCEPVVSVGGR